MGGWGCWAEQMNEGARALDTETRFHRDDWTTAYYSVATRSTQLDVAVCHSPYANQRIRGR